MSLVKLLNPSAVRASPAPAALAIAFLAIAFLALPAAAQSVSIGSGFVSRYVWRGTDFGESLSAQPGLSVSSHSFTVGAWASYSLAADGAGANEADLFVSYAVPVGRGWSITAGITDYYFPSPNGPAYSNYDGDGTGAHWIEPFVSISGKLNLLVAVMAHNDPDRSLYVEASLPIAIDETEITFLAAGVGGASAFYHSTGATPVMLGVRAAKSIRMTNEFSLPTFVSYLVNPNTDRAFLVFGITL